MQFKDEIVGVKKVYNFPPSKKIMNKKKMLVLPWTTGKLTGVIKIFRKKICQDS